MQRSIRDNRHRVVATGKLFAGSGHPFRSGVDRQGRAIYCLISQYCLRLLLQASVLVLWSVGVASVAARREHAAAAVMRLGRIPQLDRDKKMQRSRRARCR